MGTYYTCRILGETTVEVSKWEESADRPSQVYRVHPYTNSCNCAAMKRDCKHVQIAKCILDPEFINEAYRWRFIPSEGWVEMFDIPYEQHFKQGVRALCHNNELIS